jgi:hypothetical protein
MIYILIIIATLQGRDGRDANITHSIEFNSSKACVSASIEIAKYSNKRQSIICVPKG